MNRISTKMKLLSLAILGLGGIALAGSASAACPASPTAWSSNTATMGTLNVVSGGYDGTSCKLSTSLNQNSLLFAKSIVTDTSPSDEPRYRAQFLVDTSEMAAMNNVLKQVAIFTASAQTAPAGVPSDEVQMILVGSSGGPALRILVADSNQPTNFQVIDVPLATQLGVNRIEFDLVQGSNATFKYWVSAQSATTAEGSPTGSTSVNNSAWSGATQASLGMFSASNGYRSALSATDHLYFDQFDSRRTTFIGH